MSKKTFICHLILFPLAMLAVSACALRQDIYSDPENWYQSGKAPDPSLCDVFYVLPTCVHDWTDGNGSIHHNASLGDTLHRRRMQSSFELAERIFADSANFFSPYYRQASLEAWTESEEVQRACFETAMEDVSAAFSHYAKYDNGGRPFLLAGFSQGGRCVVELMKSMPRPLRSRMAAAYVCGSYVTTEDLKAAPWIKAASGAEDTGVTVVYNSFADLPVGKADIPGDGNAFVINPVSWTTDTCRYSLNDSVAVRIDEAGKRLLVSGVDPASAYSASLARIFPASSLHRMELSLYEELLRRNVKTRIRAYRARNVSRE